MTDSEGEIGRHPAYIGVMIPICVLGLLLNLLVVVIVTRCHRLKCSVDVFLANLAAAEILQTLLVFPVHIRNSVNYEHNFYGDSAVCKLVMVVPLVLVTAAIFSMVVMAIDRYRYSAVCKLVMFVPLVLVTAAIFSMVVMAIDRYRCVLLTKTLGTKAAFLLVGLVWLLSLIVSGPQIYEYDTYQKYFPTDNLTLTSCGSAGVSDSFKTVYASVVFTVGYGIPLVILVFSYSRILHFVWKNANAFLKRRDGSISVEHAVGGAERNITARKVKLLKLVINITASFIVLWTPYFIVFAISELGNLDDSSHQMQWPHVVGQLLAASSTVVNPLVFLAFSARCRHWLAHLLACRNPFREENRFDDGKQSTFRTKTTELRRGSKDSVNTSTANVSSIDLHEH